MPARNMLV